MDTPCPFFQLERTIGKAFTAIMSVCVCRHFHRRHKHTLILRTWNWTQPTWGAFSSYTQTLRWREAYWRGKARQCARRQTRRSVNGTKKKTVQREREREEKNEHPSHKRTVMWECRLRRNSMNAMHWRTKQQGQPWITDNQPFDCQLVVHACN